MRRHIKSKLNEWRRRSASPMLSLWPKMGVILRLSEFILLLLIPSLFTVLFDANRLSLYGQCVSRPETALAAMC